MSPAPGESVVHVRDVLSGTVLNVEPTHTLREAARSMARRRMGSALVTDPHTGAMAIITERDLLVSLGVGEDPDVETVSSHVTRDVVYASADWTIEEAAVTMVRGDFRHLVVLDDGEPIGMLSIRDIIRVWTDNGEIVETPPTVTPHRRHDTG
jgi:signal-transduction protein with cAMP-binding, CBS, and nucleotidyltransferase domain